jgi:ArsR family transcriptional regulator, cadmium/lead-responsive transcriptional repressor
MIPSVIEREILIEAPVETVWGVVTEPDQISRWFSDIAEIDMRPGGEGTLTFTNRATNQHATVRLLVESIEPPHKFSFRWDYPDRAKPDAGNSLHVEFTRAAEGSGTRPRVAESGLPRCGGRTTKRRPTSTRTARAGTFTWRACRIMSQASPEPQRGGQPQDSGGQPQDGGDEQLWEAVAEPSRRRVLDLLLAHGEATPTMLATELPFTRQAVAKHLAVLNRAGLVEGRRQGREVHYSVRPDRLNAAAQAMAHVAARWDVRLGAIKHIAEERARTTPAEPPPDAE